MGTQFNSVWDNYELGERQVGVEFFSGNVGYDSEHKRAIEALAIGEEWQCSDGSNHTVTRLS